MANQSKSNNLKKVNIVIPCYNEQKRIINTLKSLDQFLARHSHLYNFKVYIVNDGSIDFTQKIIGDFIGNSKFKKAYEVLSYRVNKGKGYAVRFGMLKSRKADYYYLADADLSSSWNTLNELLKIALNGYDCVIGSRGLEQSKVDTSYLKKLLGRIGNFLIVKLLNVNVLDTQCGYKLFSRKCLPAFLSQTINRWGFDFEVLYLLKKMGVDIKEVSIVWKNKEGSKVKPLDYIRTFGELLSLVTKDKFNKFTADLKYLFLYK